ncbi:MAG: protein-(glutamine-N5) methyltransferase, release factor-specific [Flavobacteriales bacterium]|nr:protein-(glutamine-N5) methyltransferase, release factor-specific [Flavobacteriales bacterium]
MNTVTSVKKRFIDTLGQNYSFHELSSMWSQWVVKELLNKSSINYFLEGDFMVSEIDENLIDSLILHLSSYKPIQYFFGYSYFKNLKIQVDASVLIPRPETEQLVDMVIDYVKENKVSTIIDIGTGSGCISIAIGKKIKSNIFAIDVSSQAIAKATSNSKTHQVDIDFKLIDILNVDLYKILPKVDLIVSNPPYVLKREVPEKSVVHSEPKHAIFVPDDDPLIFYKSILNFAKTNLNRGGKIFLEINPLLVSKLIGCMSKYGYSDIQVCTDFYQKKRFIIVS